MGAKLGQIRGEGRRGPGQVQVAVGLRVICLWRIAIKAALSWHYDPVVTAGQVHLGRCQFWLPRIVQIKNDNDKHYSGVIGVVNLHVIHIGKVQVVFEVCRYATQCR